MSGSTPDHSASASSAVRPSVVVDRAGGKAALTVAMGILISRLVGLLRNTAFAYYFGASAASDAYNAAFKIPGAIRNLLGEGALSASFVPVYSQLLEREDKTAARALANAMLGVLLAAVALLTLAGILAAPWLTTLLAPGFDEPTRELTTRLTRVLFPMTGVMVLSGWCLGVQNSHRRFFWSYASAAAWSLAQIALLLVWGPRAQDAATLAWWLSWATLVGALLQVAAQMPEVLRLARPIVPTLAFHAEGLMQSLRNVVPVVTALGAVQVSAFIDLQIASFLPKGATTNLTYASLLSGLPISLFGVSVAAAALPDLARDSGSMDRDTLRERVRAGWQRILFYIVPSAFAFMALGDYCVGILYRAGRFGAQEQRIVYLVLAASAIGLVSFASVKLLASAHYALQDYRTPLRASIAGILLSAVIAISIAVPMHRSPLGVAGIALGSALGSYVNLSLLVRGLRARLGNLYTSAMWRGTRRIILSGLVATVAGLVLKWAHLHWMPSLHTRLAGIPILAVYGVTYLLVAWWNGSLEAARWLRLKERVRA